MVQDPVLAAAGLVGVGQYARVLSALAHLDVDPGGQAVQAMAPPRVGQSNYGHEGQFQEAVGLEYQIRPHCVFQCLRKAKPPLQKTQSSTGDLAAQGVDHWVSTHLTPAVWPAAASAETEASGISLDLDVRVATCKRPHFH